MEKSLIEKWEGKASTKLTKASADQIWSLFTDFFNLHKWFPNISTCYGIHGVNGEVGCERYCAGLALDNSDSYDGHGNWAKSRLLAVDRNEMTMTYEIFESNMGFYSYISTLKVIGGGAEGCVVEWSFIIDPVEGVTREFMVESYQDILDRTTNKMEAALVEKKAT